MSTCVCVCVSVSVCLSVCPRGYLRNHTCDLFCMLPMAVARSSSGVVSDMLCTSGTVDDIMLFSIVGLTAI